MESEYIIDTLSVSHDGSLIAGAGSDGLVKVWEVNTGQLINTFRHDTRVKSIAFSPTENILASGSRDTTVKLWDTVIGTEIYTIQNPDVIDAVAFSPDGKILAWRGAGKHTLPDTINLWDVATQSLIAVYERPTSIFHFIDCLALSPDNKTFVTVDHIYDIVKVWDINTGNTIDLGHIGLTPDLGHIGLTPISFSTDSTMLATGGTRGVKLWDVNTGRDVANIPIKPRSSVTHASFSPDGRTLAYRVSGEKFTRLWDVTTQTQTGIIENPSVDYWAFSPDGKILASAARHIITLWDVVTGQPIATLEGPLGRVSHITYSPDGNTLASVSRDRTVRLWDIATNQNIETFDGTSYAAFSPDGTMLVFRKNGGLEVWNLITRDMAIIDGNDFMAFLPDSSMMLLRSFGHENRGSVSVWDAKTSTFITTLDSEIFEDRKRPIFSPDGKTLAIMGQDSTILFEPEVIYNQLPLSALSDANTESLPITVDVNSDGSVNILDLVLIASELGNTGQNLAVDVNGDGVVNVFDLILVAGMFDGAAAAPSAQLQLPATLTAVEVQGWLTDASSLEAKDPIMKRGFLILKQLLASLTPTETELLANYPNPFNPETWIPYRLAEDAFVTLTIYDGAGQVVRTLDVGHQIAAVYENRSKAIYWDGRNGLGEQVASGVYFYHLSAGDYSATRKMVILK